MLITRSTIAPMKRVLVYSMVALATVSVLSYGAFISYSNQQKQTHISQPTATPFVVPSTWKHYTSATNRIQFSYPESLHLSEAKDTVVIEIPQNQEKSKIEIAVVDPIQNKKVFELYSFAIHESRETPFGSFERKDDRYFGSAECFVYEQQNSQVTQEFLYVCTHENTTYLVDALTHPNGITQKMFSDILLSLRFIPQQ